MTPAPKTALEYTIKVRKTTWEALRARAGLLLDRELADAMNVSEATVYKVFAGIAEPGARFIAHALRAFPFASFDRLFEAVPRVAR